jgi:hypothetical protein
VPPDFLNSREDAILFWSFVILAFVVLKDPRGMASASYGVLRAALHWKLVGLYGTAAAYCAGVVYAAEQIGLWHATALKATIYWFIGTAVVLVGEAVSNTSGRDSTFRRRVLRRVAAWTIFLEFAVNLYALPFLVEAAVLFVVIAFVGMQAVIEGGLTPADPATRKLIEVVLGWIGTLYFVYFLARAFTDPGGLWSRQHAEDFLVGPALTVALIPFLSAVTWYSRRELARLRRQFSL